MQQSKMARCIGRMIILVVLAAAAGCTYAQQDLCPQLIHCTWQFAVTEQQLSGLGWDSASGSIDVMGGNPQLSITVKCARTGSSSSNSLSASLQCAANQVSITSGACSSTCDNSGRRQCVPTTFDLQQTGSNLALVSSNGVTWFTCVPSTLEALVPPASPSRPAAAPSPRSPATPAPAPIPTPMPTPSPSPSQSPTSEMVITASPTGSTGNAPADSNSAAAAPASAATTCISAMTVLLVSALTTTACALVSAAA